ncbi:MAG TPA: SMC-Scp complex subunit ScpB [Kofleriaceae bacterium]
MSTSVGRSADDGADDGDASDGDAVDDDDAAVVFPTSAASMDAVQLKHLVEALIFASDRPLTVQRLRQLTRVGDVRRLEQALAELSEDYGERGLILQQVSGGYQFRTRTQFSAWVQQLIAGRPVRLSRAQLETLAIIAYRQPITRPEIDDIRGVDSTATLKLLIDRMLIRVLGKREEVGRPMLYGTTKEFLDFFSLGDLRELPTLREYSELTAESRRVMSDRLGIAPDGDGGDGSGGSGPEGNGSGGNGGGFDGGGFNGGGFAGGGFSGGGLSGGGLDDGDLDDGGFDSSRADGGDGGDGPLPGAGGGASDDGTPVSASAAELSEALSAFWATSAAVDRSTATEIEETDDDAPADTWFDPAIGNALDEPGEREGDEPIEASGERGAAPGSPHIEPVENERAGAAGSSRIEPIEALDERSAAPGPPRAEPVAE